MGVQNKGRSNIIPSKRHSENNSNCTAQHADTQSTQMHIFNITMYKVLVGKPEGKRPLGRPRRRWEEGIRMDLREIGLRGVDWIRLAQARDWWRAVVSAVMNLRVLAPRS
jgi:hypothetical protein